MSDTNFRLNIAGLISISNQVNETVCAGIADRVADAAVPSWQESNPRSSSPRATSAGWARQFVRIPMSAEVRDGRLAKALGQAGT